jgi:hypothetical protein
MNMNASIFNSSHIKLEGLSTDYLSESGLQIDSPLQLLKALGYESTLKQLNAFRLTVIHGDIQNSQSGVIQDPAGSAVGVAEKPASQFGVGGGSKAIYSTFKDLDPIPDIPMGASVFNTSSGPGRRVLHTYSPMLPGLPDRSQDCQTALQMLANGYANALNAANHPPTALAESGEAQLINLIPISGRIYAGAFRDSSLNHLHPSYTLTAIAIAQMSLLQSNQNLLQSTLYYHDLSVYSASLTVLEQIYSIDQGQ